MTKLLQAWGQGQDAALDELLPLVHQELRRLARRYMFGEHPGHTLQTTALVNEAYLRLVNSRQVNWQNRAHFFAISAQLMRRILVDSARARRDQKRGGGVPKVTLDEALVGPQEKGQDLVALDDALKALVRSGSSKEPCGGAALFRRAECRGDRRGAESSPEHGSPRLEAGQDVAATRDEQKGI